LEQILLAS
jgi:DNA polymerase theta